MIQFQKHCLASTDSANIHNTLDRDNSVPAILECTDLVYIQNHLLFEEGRKDDAALAHALQQLIGLHELEHWLESRLM
jgi:hypothetical protein